MKKILILLIIIGVIAGFYFFQKGNIFKQVNPTASKEDLIIVDTPKIGDRITSPLVIRGQARGSWYFEATFPVVLTDWDGKIIAQHHAQAQGEWMTNDFVPFEAKLEFVSPVFPDADKNHFSRRGTLILQKDNPSGLPEYDNAIEFEVFFE